jgi:hypothetical protein
MHWQDDDLLNHAVNKKFDEPEARVKPLGAEPT